MLSIPFEPTVVGIKINVHLILEYLAFIAGYRYYVYLRRGIEDPIPTINRLSIILGAAIGALIGSRVMGLLENPNADFAGAGWFALLNVKTIMGGLFGGLLGVELAKVIVKEKHSSGDLFTLPIIVGLIIGRIGCLLAGTHEFTYGTTTTFFTGMDLGDGMQRHPLALYEIAFLLILFFGLRRLYRQHRMESGMLFRIFMISYFGFRFFLEFLKPNVFYLWGLSSIQWLCIICFVYYHKTLRHAYQKVHLL